MPTISNPINALSIRNFMFRKFYALRSGWVAWVAYVIATLLHHTTHHRLFATARVHLAYILNRNDDLGRMSWNIVKHSDAYQSDQRLLHVLLKAAWTLQDDELLTLILETLANADQVSMNNLSYLAARRNHPAITACAEQMRNAIYQRIKTNLQQYPLDTDQLGDQIGRLDALGMYDLPEDTVLHLNDISKNTDVHLFLAQTYALKEDWAMAWDHGMRATAGTAIDFKTYAFLSDVALYFPDPNIRIQTLIKSAATAGVVAAGYNRMLGYKYLLNDDYDTYLRLRDTQVSNRVAHQTYGAATSKSMGVRATPLISKDESAFVIGRDGVSDEVRWSYYYKTLEYSFRSIEISCDPRLHALLKRSFPKITFYPVTRNWGRAQTSDHAIPRDAIPNLELASRLDNVAFAASQKTDQVMYIEDVPLRDWLTRGQSGPPIDGEPSGTTLYPDPVRARYWKDRLTQEAGGLLKIGLIWRSGMIDADRQRHYMQLSDFADLISLPVAFYAIQHQVTEAERAEATMMGIRFVDDVVDFYDDFDEVAAMTASLDLVVGISTLPYEMAAAVGTECWLCAVSPLGRLLRLGSQGTTADRLTRNGRVFYPRCPDGYLASRPVRIGNIIDQISCALQTRITS